MRIYTTVLMFLVFGLTSAHACEPIIVGQTAAFTGGPAASVIEITAGARLIIDDVNRRGGIQGCPVQLVSLDDGYEAARAIENAEILARDRKAVGLLISRGTEPTEALLPHLSKHRIPLIGPSTGAMTLRNPVHPYVFNVRASYQGEARKSVEQLVSMGFDQIGIVYVDDAFGKDSLKGLLDGFSKKSVRPSFVEKFQRNQKDFTNIIQSAVRAKPRALILIGTNAPIVTLLEGLQAAGVRAYVATLSNNASEGFLRAVSGKATAVVVSQVFPSERAQHLPVVRELTALSKQAAERPTTTLPASDPASAVEAFMALGKLPSPAMLEGAIAARVLVAGLRRIKGQITRESLTAALNSGGPIDVGWTDKKIEYSPTDHNGIEFTDTSVIRDGKFIR